MEQRDQELNRAVRVAELRTETGFPIKEVPALLDATLISAKPDWWTMTGWARIDSGDTSQPRAYQQSWILVPVDRA